MTEDEFQEHEDEIRDQTVSESVHETNRRHRSAWLIAIVALAVGLVGALIGAIALFDQWERQRDQAVDATQFAFEFQTRCNDPETRVGDLEDLCNRAERVVERSPDEPEIQESEVQDPEIQDPEIQDPEIQDPERQDPEMQDPEVQDPEIQDPEIQDPEFDDPDPDDPETQDPEFDDPEPNDPQDPAETLTIEGINSQAYKCFRNEGSPPRNPTYTCEVVAPQPD